MSFSARPSVGDSTGCDIAVCVDASPFVMAYSWSNGFGTKYADPATLPAVAQQTNVKFSPDKKSIAVASYDSVNPISVYPWNNGFGTKFSNPSTLPTGPAHMVAFSPSGADIAVAHMGSPYVSVYPFSSSGFGTKYANPSTLPNGDAYSVVFSPSGADIVIGDNGGANQSSYPWSSGFGTKYTPVAIPAVPVGASFFPSGNGIAFALSTTTFSRLVAIPFTSGAGFGGILKTVGGFSGSVAHGVDVSPSGNYVGCAYASSPWISVFEWYGFGSGFGGSYSPSPIISGPGLDIAFSPSEKEVAVAHAGSPYISVYPWNSPGFGTKYANPSTLPAAACAGITWKAP